MSERLSEIAVERHVKDQLKKLKQRQTWTEFFEDIIKSLGDKA